MAQPITGPLAAPTHLRTRQQPIKKTNVELLKNGLEIVSYPVRRTDLLPAPDLPNQMRLA